MTRDRHSEPAQIALDQERPRVVTRCCRPPRSTGRHARRWPRSTSAAARFSAGCSRNGAHNAPAGVRYRRVIMPGRRVRSSPVIRVIPIRSTVVSDSVRQSTGGSGRDRSAVWRATVRSRSRCPATERRFGSGSGAMMRYDARQGTAARDNTDSELNLREMVRSIEIASDFRLNQLFRHVVRPRVGATCVPTDSARRRRIGMQPMAGRSGRSRVPTEAGGSAP